MSEESYEAMLKKREYVLRELVDTEDIYVSDLALVCEGYIRHFQVPMELVFSYDMYKRVKSPTLQYFGL